MMSRLWKWPLVAVLALVALALPAGRPALAAAPAAHTGTSVTSYKAGLKSLLNMFIKANNQVIALGNDLQKSSFHKASADGTRAVAGIKRAKSKLDHLSVPSRATKIQSLMEKAFGKFLSGAALMQRGVSTRNLTGVTKGTSVYQAGLLPLEQAGKLMQKLK